MTNGLDASICYNDAGHLRNAYIINLTSDRTYVKEMIMKYGAVGVSYFHDYSCYSETYNSFYNSKVEATNHSVTVVGWNDDFPKENFSDGLNGGAQPSSNGAWLIRNSWSQNDYSLYGYFWISYEDLGLCSEPAYVFDFVSELSDEFYDNNYQYDGAEDSGGIGNWDGGSATCANIFTCQNKLETLEAVMYGVRSVNTSYKIEIYTNLTDDTDPTSGTKEATLNGSQLYAGMHTVKLDTPINLI